MQRRDETVVERAEQAERPLERFLPRRGDVLLWHPGLVHGGSPIRTDGATRLSLVGHYCPQDVRPLYHWHRPASRNIRAGDDGWATSWHYP